MLTFPCPVCKKLLKTPEAFAGKMLRCPGCQHQFQAPLLPAPSSLKPAAAAKPFSPEPPEDEPLSLPLADDQDEAVTPNQPLSVQDEEDDAEKTEANDDSDSSPTRRKKKRKKRKRKKSDSLLDTFRYYTDAFGAFPWVILGLLGVWVLVAAISFLVPPFALILIGLGGVLYLSGWLWFLMVAFRDDGFHGALCIITHFYWFIYLFLNLEEAWRPTALMVLGILIAASGFGLLVAFSGPWAEPGAF